MLWVSRGDSEHVHQKFDGPLELLQFVARTFGNLFIPDRLTQGVSSDGNGTSSDGGWQEF